MNKDEKAGLWSERIREFRSSGQTCRDWCIGHARHARVRPSKSFARAATKYMACENMGNMLDLKKQITELCDRIKRWNGL